MTNYDAMGDPDTFVPPHMRPGFVRWIEHRILPGGFAVALLRNDIESATLRADHINKSHIGSIVKWLERHAPADCWGDLDKITNWPRGNPS